FDHIVLRVIGYPEKRQPLRLDLVAQRERKDFDFGTFADEGFRYPIEEVVPFGLFKLLHSHRSPPSPDGKRGLGTVIGVPAQAPSPRLLTLTIAGRSNRSCN